MFFFLPCIVLAASSSSGVSYFFKLPGRVFFSTPSSSSLESLTSFLFPGAALSTLKEDSTPDELCSYEDERGWCFGFFFDPPFLLDFSGIGSIPTIGCPKCSSGETAELRSSF